MKKDNKGFTLVEVVVVVVMLTVLATMLIPTFTKYLTQKNDEKNEEDAKNLFESAQVEFYGLYARNAHHKNNTCVIESPNSTNQKCFSEYDVDCKAGYNAKEITDIFNNISMSYKVDFPCNVALIVGDYKTYASDSNDINYDPQKAYTVYGILFQQYHEREYFILDINGDKPYYPESVNDLKNKLNGFKDDGGNKIVTQLYFIKCGKDNNSSAGTTWGIYTGSKALNANKTHNKK